MAFGIKQRPANENTLLGAKVAAQIVGSMREVGFGTLVLVVSANGIIAGQGQVLAARSLGLVAVPAIALSHPTKVQKQPFELADNMLGKKGGRDQAMLTMEAGG